LDGFEISDNLGPHETCTLVDLGIGSPGGMFSHSDTAVTSRESDLNSLRNAQGAAIEAFVSRNADHMVSAYSADASLMFPNAPTLQGEDLRTAIRALAADPNFSIQFSTDRVEVAKSGEIG
jgi:hypothetical protein